MTVYPFVLHLGPLELTGYGLMMMVAFLMAGWAIQLYLRERQLDEDYAADIVIAGVIGGLLGAKIWYVLLTGETDALLRRGTSVEDLRREILECRGLRIVDAGRSVQAGAAEVLDHQHESRRPA